MTQHIVASLPPEEKGRGRSEDKGREGSFGFGSRARARARVGRTIVTGGRVNVASVSEEEEPAAENGMTHANGRARAREWGAFFSPLFLNKVHTYSAAHFEVLGG